MFSQDRDSLRRFYLQCWQKAQNRQPLDALEQQIATVIQEHPEYHAALNLSQAERIVGQDYSPEQGDTNPFLHMGLHLGLREQVTTDRPPGILAIYQDLQRRYGPQEAEHRMMECLAESIWKAQHNQTAPDEASYLICLKNKQLQAS